MGRKKVISINEDSGEKLVGLKEFSELIGVNKKRVYAMIKQGTLKGHRNRGVVALPCSQIEVAKNIFSKHHNYLVKVLGEMGNPCSANTALRLWGEKYKFYRNVAKWAIPDQFVDEFKKDAVSYLDTSNLFSNREITQHLLGKTEGYSAAVISQIIRTYCDPVKKVLNKYYYSSESIDIAHKRLEKYRSVTKKRKVFYSRPVIAKDVRGGEKRFEDAASAVKWLKSKGIKSACRHAIYQQISELGRHTAYGLAWSYAGEKAEVK